MKIVSVSVVNDRQVDIVSIGRAVLAIPAEVPLQVIELLRRRLDDRIARPVAWKRRNAREQLRDRVKQIHGRKRVKRHLPVRAPRYRRRGMRGSFRRRWGLAIWSPHMS